MGEPATTVGGPPYSAGMGILDRFQQLDRRVVAKVVKSRYGAYVPDRVENDIDALRATVERLEARVTELEARR